MLIFLKTGSEPNHDAFFKYCFLGYVQIIAQLDWAVLLKPSSTEPGSSKKRQHWSLWPAALKTRSPSEKGQQGFGLDSLLVELETTDNSRSGLFILQKKGKSLSKETSKCWQRRMRKKWSEERHTTDMATFFFFFFFLLWTLALSWLPYTSKGPASWKYHEVAHLVPESHKNKIDNATSSG